MARFENNDRIYHISDQQRSEYFRAFSASASSEALRKYLTIRISSCLCSLVYKFSDEEAEKIENECQFLQKLFPEWAVDLDIILEVSKHIRQLDSTNRMEKLNLLQKLDTTGGRSGVTGTNLCGESQTDIHIRIEPTPRYLSVVKASASSLRMAVQTGSIHSADEENEWLKAREHDFNLIQNLGQNSIGTTARDAIWHHRDDPDKVVAALKPHIEQLLDAANKISPENLGSLQLWYSIDGISAALVKLEKWDESRFWLELFFNLDIHLQESVPKSEKEKMLKRLERCKSLC